MFALHLSILALIIAGSGIVAVFVGGRLALSFNVSDLLPPIGVLLFGCGCLAVPVALGIQIGAWVHG